MTDPLPQTAPDAREPLDALYRDLRSRPSGLTQREAERRIVAYGPNELVKRSGRRWPAELIRQVIHPLALLLEVAAILAFAGGLPALAIAILVVVALNAVFAFVQEQHAERAVEALRAYLPQQATVRRDGGRATVDAVAIVPGDVLIVAEGDRVSADARLILGSVEVDLSTLTGESQPVLRTADHDATARSLLEARDVVFSGTSCVGGEAEALVVATGMQTELGRIAALSERVVADPSPLEQQVRRVAWLIAAVAVGAGAAFLPIGWLVAGLPIRDALSFAIGLIVANVPEGLLPTITLALAVGVSQLARGGALVKRLSAVETLGSTTVICTDKTGTLTENRMRPSAVWTADGEVVLEGGSPATNDGVLRELADAVAACSTAELALPPGKSRGEATEVGMLEAASLLGADTLVATRQSRRVGLNRFDPTLRLMSAIVRDPDGSLAVVAKGAPEELLGRCGTVARRGGPSVPLAGAARDEALAAVSAYATRGLRVLAVARREVDELPADRAEAERDLVLLGVVALFDPPRPEVEHAVRECHRAGVRILVVTGDFGATAAEIARRVGIGGEQPRIVAGHELDALSEPELDRLLRSGDEIVFSRAAPETKLRIADALRAQGHVVAMTGDGVNDAPALRRADIGVAMGLTGTDVARQAATMILTDDNFATIVSAIGAGRRVFENVRKFVLYIFAHATPEVVPFLVFALAGGAIPLPLTVLQILAIDLGTEILPALALGREPAEPGLMDRPPRSRSEGVITREMLMRAWVTLGLLEAGLVLGGFFGVLLHAGWRPGDDVSAGTPLHHAYLQATTMSFAGIVACQVGTAIAARADRASLRAIGVASNPLLLLGILSEIVFAAAVIYAPPFQTVFATAGLGPVEVAVLLAFPVLVWGSDELRRAHRRRTAAAGRR